MFSAAEEIHLLRSHTRTASFSNKKNYFDRQRHRKDNYYSKGVCYATITYVNRRPNPLVVCCQAISNH